MNVNEDSLRTALRRKGIELGSPLYFFETAGSTNSLAAGLAKQGAPEGTAVIANQQTHGRGRMKRTWHSPPGLNLYTSLILRPDVPPASSSSLTILAGLAVAELLHAYVPHRVRLKWPNDVLIDNKKISGILTEMRTSASRVAFVVLGIGININMEESDFPPILEPIATSLRRETGQSHDRVDLTVTLYALIGHYYRMWLNEGLHPILDSWMSYAQLMDQDVEVTFGDEVHRGRVTGLDDRGALVMKDERGRLFHVLAGDSRVMRV